MKQNFDPDIIKKVQEGILSAKSSLEAAEKWFEIFLEKNDVDLAEVNVKAKTKASAPDSESEEEKIVYGEFDGESMVGEDKNKYPVSANYASKSKLVEGDKLKLTIRPSGAFIFKQIELIPRRLVTGKLILDGNQYKVLADDKSFNVLYASVTFHRGNVGDNITIIAPEDPSKSWAAIENILPEQ